VAQQDEGSFQIESVVGSELAAAAGKLQVQQYGPSGIGQTLRLSGSFPTLRWAGAGNFLTWELDLTLLTGSPKLDVVLRLNWKGESTRLRLKLPTTLDTSEGIYEIPFGTVRRKPYANRGTARGEWPAHRFVAVEAEGHGIALANTGTAGVEVSGGTLYTSLLRSPKAQYAGMVADDTSAQHGEHEFRFGLIPYAGTWDTAGVAKYAQELNNPIKTRINAGAPVPDSSFLRLDSETVILSVVKKPEDEADELIVRVYETAGRESITTLWVRDAVKARHSDLTEKPFEEISCESGNIRFDIKPFEIKTFRIERRAGIR
jgi:alpha-mannosidase